MSNNNPQQDRKGVSEATGTPLDTSNSTPRNRSFPQKLRTAIAAHPDILQWSANGLVFCIHSPTQFEAVVLPRHFPTTKKYLSFTRQLNRWGFRRAGPSPPFGSDELILFFHAHFQRDAPELLQHMAGSPEKRVRKKKTPSIGNLRESQTMLHQRLQGVDAFRVNDALRPSLSQRLDALVARELPTRPDADVMQRLQLDTMRMNATDANIFGMSRSQEMMRQQLGLERLRASTGLPALQQQVDMSAWGNSGLDALRSTVELEALRNRVDLALLQRAGTLESSLFGGLPTLAGSLQSTGGMDTATATAIHQRRQTLLRLQLDVLERLQQQQQRHDKTRR